MSFLLAIEGADGVGKATAAKLACEFLNAQGLSSTVISFPRYGETVGGIALGQFLAGEMSVPVSVREAAVLYAMDRMESVRMIADLSAQHDIIVFDRYIASNMVYQSSKVPRSEAAALMQWIWRLETETFGIPPADLTIYLDTPSAIARDLIRRKARRSYTDREYDEHEADTELQEKVRLNYERIAASTDNGRWKIARTTHGNDLRPPADIAGEIVARVMEALPQNSDPAKP